MSPQSDIVADFVRRHNVLIESMSRGAPDVAAMRAFSREVSEAGALVPDPRDRDRLHRILTYWAAREGALVDTPQELPRLKPATVEPEAVTARPDASTSIEGMSALSFGRMDEQELQRTTMLVRLVATARHWRKAPEASKEGILLSGPSLDEAEKLADEDIDLRAFVDASRANVERRYLARERARLEQEEKERRERRNIWILLTALVALAAGSLMYQQKLTEDELRKAATELLKSEAALKKTNTEQSHRLKSIRDKAVDAVDQFSDSDPSARSLLPLQQLLRELGNATDDEVNLLDFKSTAVATPRQDLPRDAVNAAPSLANQLTCEGVLWIGSENDRKIDDPLPVLANLTPGQSFLIRTRTDINLRADYPTERYELKPVVGVVPNGARILVAGAPKSYPRGDKQTNQYWVQVKVAQQNCTRVFIQHAGGPEKVGPVAKALELAGFQVPPAQSLSRAGGMSEVRYYWSGDEPMARAAAAEIERALGGRKVGVRSLEDFDIKPGSRVIEAWIDLRS